MTELLKKAKESALKRTDENRRRILIDAKILTEEGSYHSDYFSEDTVEESRKAVEIEKMLQIVNEKYLKLENAKEKTAAEEFVDSLYIENK